MRVLRLLRRLVPHDSTDNARRAAAVCIELHYTAGGVIRGELSAVSIEFTRRDSIKRILEKILFLQLIQDIRTNKLNLLRKLEYPIRYDPPTNETIVERNKGVQAFLFSSRILPVLIVHATTSAIVPGRHVRAPPPSIQSSSA